MCQNVILKYIIKNHLKCKIVLKVEYHQIDSKLKLFANLLNLTFNIQHPNFQFETLKQIFNPNNQYFFLFISVRKHQFINPIACVLIIS